MSALQNRKKKYLSNAEVSCFKTDPAAWYMQYVLNIRGGSQAKFERGKSVEKAIEFYLKEEFADADDAVEFCIKDFNRSTALGYLAEDREKELKNLDGYVRQGIEAFKDFGAIQSTQDKIMFDFDGVPIPIMGYDDFRFKKDGKLYSIDLKTTERCPKEAILPYHKMQAAIYASGLPDHTILFCYVTPKKFAVHEMTSEEAKQLMIEFVQIAKRIDKYLALDAQEIPEYLVPDYSNFYWSDKNMREEAERIFGF